MPRIWYLWKILAAGYQLCWSRGTWTQLPHSAQCQYFASGALLCSHLNFWHPLAACEQRHYCHLWMIFFIEPLESEEPVSCLELRELSPAISLPRLLERNTLYVLPSTLKTSEFTSDKWVQMDLPVPARVLPEWGWGLWPDPRLWKAGSTHAWFHPTKECGLELLSLHGTDSRALLVYTSPKKKQFGVLILQLLTWLATTQAQSLGSCSVCFHAFPTLGFVLLWQEREGMVTPEDFAQGCAWVCLNLGNFWQKVLIFYSSVRHLCLC